jgi:hypothetical protein
MQLHQNMSKLLQNLSALYLSNTVQLDSTQLGASAQQIEHCPAVESSANHLTASTQQSTPTQPVEQLDINTTEKLGLATQLVGMLGTVANHDKISEALATPDRGIAAVPNSRNLSGTVIKMNTNLRRSVNDAVLEAMKNQFYKVYGPMYDEAHEGGSGLPTKKKYDQYVEALQCYHKSKKRNQFMKNTNTRFSLGTNLKDNNLFR